MNSVTEPVIKQTRHNIADGSARDWLDAVSSGACTREDFFRAANDLLGRTPDAGWELLALIDQYYRRGKLSAHAFGDLKAHLQGLLVGKGDADEISVPTPAMQDEPPAAGVQMAAPAPDRARPTTAPTSRSPPLRESAARRARNITSPVAAVDQDTATAGGAAPRSLAPGDVLRERYVIQGLLGQGGMGTVYSAIDQFRLDRSATDQKVAIKVLHTEVIKRPRLFAELRREFQHLQSLSHPNIVRVHEYDRDGDLAFFTMEYLSGALLSRVLALPDSARLHRPYALALVRDVGAAVAHAHARGVVHGDLNPGNIFITDSGEVRVLDFGASHQLHRGPWISEFDQEQVAVATPAYASCQILEGEAADARDDIYALACIAYVLLTGRHPYLESTALKARTLKLEPKRPSGLERRQWHALRAGLEFSRERRPADMQAWLAQLDLRAAAPTLPALLSLGTTRGRYSSPFAGSRAPAITGLAGLLIVGAWAAATHFDSIAAAAGALGALGARFKTMAAGALSSPVWDKGLPIGGHPDPVIQPPPGSDEVGVSIDSTASTHSADHGPVVAPAAPSNRSGSAAHLPVAERGRSPVAPESPAVHPQAAARSATDAPGRPPATANLVARAAAPVIPSSASPSGNGSSESPHSRIELAADSVEVAPGEPMAHIVVRRRGNLRGDASFSWWTESGTAKPGRDFVPVKTQIEHIDNGQSALSLIIPVVKDPAQRESRSFYVVIDQPSENATLGRTLTMVTIPGSDPSQPSADQ